MTTLHIARTGATGPPSVMEMLAVWEAERDLQFTRRSAIYVSTPITTGFRYIEWFATIGKNLPKGSDEYARALRSDVILPNIQRAARFMELFRWRHMGVIIDPTSLDVPGWSQPDYHRFWMTVIDRHARRVILLKGWEFSRGCTLEFETAQRFGIDCVDEDLQPLTRERGLHLVKSATERSHAVGADTTALEELSRKLEQEQEPTASSERTLYKDEVLDHLAWTANVAQFVSFAPGEGLEQRFSRVLGHEPNHRFASPRDAVAALLRNAPDGKVNIRSYDPDRPEGNPFIRGLGSVDKVLGHLRHLSNDERLYTIVNETIDEHDGGVSGVAYRGLLEFAPDANPRCVDDEEIDTAVFPSELGMKVLAAVYGFEPDLRGREGARVEFSVHPKPRGWNHGHTIIWQSEQRPAPELAWHVRWPHRFSRLLGDKAFGLTLAASLGLLVPRTLVFTRRLFPYAMGSPTGSDHFWTRTSPEVKEPGFYPSARGWHDPLAVLDGRLLGAPARKTDVPPPPLASVLIQQGVPAIYSGRSISIDEDHIEVQGVEGEGDLFMLGERPPEELPELVFCCVRETHEIASHVLGHVSTEWVFDGNSVWILQLNFSAPRQQWAEHSDDIEWVEFVYDKSRLEDFRREVTALRGTNKGIVVVGNISPLSHVGEIAELNGVPIRFSEGRTWTQPRDS